MFKKAASLILMAAIPTSASHLDDTNGILSNFSYDGVKFKTQTNCSLDKYPAVS